MSLAQVRHFGVPLGKPVPSKKFWLHRALDFDLFFSDDNFSWELSAAKMLFILAG